jgi:hypothetical protein
LSWLFDGARFGEGWTPAKLRVFTKLAKALVGEGNWVSGKENVPEAVFPGRALVWMPRGGGKELVRHIRDGIAHGETKITKRGGELWILIRGAGRDSKPSAVIHIPASLIVRLHRAYLEMERGEA